LQKIKDMIRKINTEGLKELSLEEIKTQELSVLSYVTAFCERKNINYILAGGTLLGAIRHKGFIPWDDDIDIWMLRKDYEFFLSEWKKEHHEDYALFEENTRENWYLAFSKILDKKTVAIENGLEYHPEGGVWVDIFPLDPVPNNKEAAVKHLEKCRLFYEVFTIRVHLELFTRGLRKLYNLLRYLKKYRRFDIYKKPEYWYKKLRQQIASVSAEESLNVAELVCLVYVKEALAYGFSKDSLTNYIYSDFENLKFRIPQNYDEILKCFYGDYMTPPPEKDRVDNHHLKVFWRAENE